MMTPTTQPHDADAHLYCTGIWGGNKDVRHDIRTVGLTASIYSSASDGTEGGDICYVAVCGNDLLTRIILCDVQGHGPHVSELTAWIYRALRDSMNAIEGNNVLPELNEILVRKGAPANATAALITFNTSTSSLEFSYAGHPPMLLNRRGASQWVPLGAVVDNKRANLPLGMFAGTRYDRDSITLLSGDRLALYSDGVTEAESDIGEEFGQLGLSALLERCREHEISLIKDRVIDELGTHSNGAAQADDQTLILVEIA